MIVKDYRFTTPSVTICECRRLDRLYDGPIGNIPSVCLKYRVIKIIVNNVIKNTYMEVE